MLRTIWGKGDGCIILGFAVNRGAVNRGFTVIIIIRYITYITPDSTNKVQYFRIYKYLVSTVPGSHDEISAPDWFVLSRNVSEKHWLNYQILPIIINITNNYQ